MELKKGALFAAVFGLAGCGLLAALVADSPPPVPVLTTPVKSVAVTVRHVNHKEFAATYDLEVGRRVYIHDTAYWLVLLDFVGDFMLDPKTRTVAARSRQLNNPAAKVVLGYMDRPVYTAWIFRSDDAPHEIKAPGFTFSIARVQLP